MIDSGKQFVQGQWVTGQGDQFESLNPATNQVVWSGECAEAQDVVNAVMSANDALASWTTLALEDRIGYLNEFKAVLQDNRSMMAETISMEMGKPLWESTTEVSAMINKIPISIEAYEDRCKTLKTEFPTMKAITRHKPLGVVGVIGPFNFPGHLPNGHIVPALLAGNTIVFKPSDKTPMTGQRLVELWAEAGLPPGVLNLVQGQAHTALLLATSPHIDGLFFTGSAVVGEQLATLYGRYPDRVLALELGGNNPLIVDGVANIDAAVYLTIQSAFVTTGQRCTCARRLIVPKSSQNQVFVEKLAEKTAGIKVGSYLDSPEPFCGPLVSAQSANQVMEEYHALVARGAVSLTPMTRVQSDSAFVTPGIVDVTHLGSRSDEEVFGPLLQVIYVDTFEEAIQQASHTAYGLAAGLIADDPDKYQLFRRAIDAGIVNWNTPTTGASSKAPFGGRGRSGNHRPSAYYAADYCAYPVASMESQRIQLPDTPSPGLPDFS